jgi:hypothetical protein
LIQTKSQHPRQCPHRYRRGSSRQAGCRFEDSSDYGNTYAGVGVKPDIDTPGFEGSSPLYLPHIVLFFAPPQKFFGDMDKNSVMAKFAKGQSGNPGGRPSGLGEIREIARQHTDEAVQVLVNVMNDATAAPAARVGAATALLDRGWGRPAQTILASIEGKESIDTSLLTSAGDLLAQIAAGKVMGPENTRVSASQSPDVSVLPPLVKH